MLLLVPGMLRLFPTFHQNAILALLEGSSLHWKHILPRVLPRTIWRVEASQGFPVQGHWTVLEDPRTYVRRLDKYME